MLINLLVALLLFLWNISQQIRMGEMPGERVVNVLFVLELRARKLDNSLRNSSLMFQVKIRTEDESEEYTNIHTIWIRYQIGPCSASYSYPCIWSFR